MLRVALTSLSLLVLAGCSVVDLAAHGVKQYEKSKQPAGQEQSAAVQSAPVVEPIRHAEDAQTVSPPSTPGAIRSQSLD